YISRAFGKNDRPTFEEYEAFLESRCFPRERDKMKLILADLDLPFYDPFLIIEKTEGRMAEDDYWIRIEKGY
ncbi:MAG: transcriptional regulator, partial [Lachnospiraceae bacterium]|nr:transcriptional regulator [Lachnospiraceae bacterium]